MLADENAFVLSSSVSPAVVDCSEPPIHGLVTIRGFGATTENGDISYKYPHQGLTKVISDLRCGFRNFLIFIRPNEFCTLSSSVSACYFDSGGQVMLANTNTITGVISVGEGYISPYCHGTNGIVDTAGHMDLINEYLANPLCGGS